MEWYFDNEVEDLVVPKYYEQQEMISSNANWSNDLGSSNFPKKNLNSNVNMTREELTFNGGKNFYPSINMSDSNNETSKSDNSCTTQELYNDCASLLLNDEEFQRFTEEEEARTNRMDDIFFNSIFEEDPTNDSSDAILDNDANIFEGEMQYTSNENSTEESALNDLERATEQFTHKTRICFRDSFYRLAKSSKQSFLNDDTLRFQETETNVIDRAVGSLMFSQEFDSEENDDQQAVSCCQHQTDYNDDPIVPQWGETY